MGKGLIQVYTGDGKGKTTAAIGLAIRALGAGKKVAFIQFMKSIGYSEHAILRRLSPNLELYTFGKPFFIAKEGAMTEEDCKQYGTYVIFPEGQPPREYVELIKNGIVFAETCVTSGAYDLVVLDEINCALYFELFSWPIVSDLLDKRHEKTEVVLTGRKAPEELIVKADLVTEMKEVKHYYTQGIQSRLGIEN